MCDDIDAVQILIAYIVIDILLAAANDLKRGRLIVQLTRFAATNKII